MGRAYDSNIWYFFVTCKDCGENIPLAVAPSPEQVADSRCPARQLPCPRCHHEGAYPSGQIGRQRGQTAGYHLPAF